MKAFADILRPYANRLANMLARGVVTAADGSTKLRTLQAKLLAGEVKDRLEHFEPYGFTSEVKPGAEALAMFFDGDRSHGVIMQVADRRYRMKGMQSGEVAVYDDLGQCVYLTRAGIVVKGGGMPLVIQDITTATVKATNSMRFETPVLNVTGDIKDNCDSGGKSMAAMRATFNPHTHPENNTAGGSTNQPNQQM